MGVGVVVVVAGGVVVDVEAGGVLPPVLDGNDGLPAEVPVELPVDEVGVAGALAVNVGVTAMPSPFINV